MTHEQRLEYFDQVATLSGEKLYEFLDSIPEELKKDRIFALYTLLEDPMSIKCFSEEIKSYKGTALAAVRCNGLALEYVSDDLKNDKEVVTYAVLSNSMAIRYASEELKENENIGLLAVANNRLSVIYVGKDTIRKLYDPYEKRMFEDYVKQRAIDLLKQNGLPEELIENETIGNFIHPFKDYDVNVEESGLSQNEIHVKRYNITKLANEKKKLFKNWYNEVIEPEKKEEKQK